MSDERIVAASANLCHIGQMLPFATYTSDGVPIEVPAMVLKEATREDWERSKVQRGIAHLPLRGGPARFFYFLSVD